MAQTAFAWFATAHTCSSQQLYYYIKKKQKIVYGNAFILSLLIIRSFVQWLSLSVHNSHSFLHPHNHLVSFSIVALDFACSNLKV